MFSLPHSLAFFLIFFHEAVLVGHMLSLSLISAFSKNTLADSLGL